MLKCFSSDFSNYAQLEGFPTPAPAGFEEFNFFIMDHGNWIDGSFIVTETFIPAVEILPGYVASMCQPLEHFPTIEEAEHHLSIELSLIPVGFFRAQIHRIKNQYTEAIIKRAQNANIPSLS